MYNLHLHLSADDAMKNSIEISNSGNNNHNNNDTDDIMGSTIKVFGEEMIHVKYHSIVVFCNGIDYSFACQLFTIVRTLKMFHCCLISKYWPKIGSNCCSFIQWMTQSFYMELQLPFRAVIILEMFKNGNNDGLFEKLTFSLIRKIPMG